MICVDVQLLNQDKISELKLSMLIGPSSSSSSLEVKYLLMFLYLFLYLISVNLADTSRNFENVKSDDVDSFNIFFFFFVLLDTYRDGKYGCD